MLDLAIKNLLSPVILFFILGFVARLGKSDLAIPGNVSKFIAIYLMMAIGYKGGFALSQYPIDSLILLTMLGGLLFSFFIPFLGYSLIGILDPSVRPTDRAAIVAHYGSVSVVTFVTATEFLKSQTVAYDSWMVAVMALMETPAIFAALILLNLKARNDKNKVEMSSDIWREIFLNGSVVILVGSFFIGFLAGEDGMLAVQPFFVDIFKGVLCLFMIDIGMVAASKIADKTQSSGLNMRLVAYGITMPVISAILGAIFAQIIGLSDGSAMLFAVLCASCSYIAVPAALRIAIPHANLPLAITLSLAITFPFNIIVGLPLYMWIVDVVGKVI